MLDLVLFMAILDNDVNGYLLGACSISSRSLRSIAFAATFLTNIPRIGKSEKTEDRNISENPDKKANVRTFIFLQITGYEI